MTKITAGNIAARSKESTSIFFFYVFLLTGRKYIDELSFPLKNFPKKANGASNIHQNLSNLARIPVSAKAFTPNDPAS